MLEHLPNWLGGLLKSVRAGHAKLAIAQAGLELGTPRIEFTSSAFADGARLPTEFTADGQGVSPPLSWRDVPDETACLALIVEDADSPTPSPLVHAIIWNVSPDVTGLGQGAIGEEPSTPETIGEAGRNSFLVKGWLPPDPPPGHGTHDYVFQLFALAHLPGPEPDPGLGRGEFLRAIAGRVIAAGTLVATYSRDEPRAPQSPVGQLRAAGA